MTTQQFAICFYVIITAFAVNYGLCFIIIWIDHICDITNKYLK